MQTPASDQQESETQVAQRSSARADPAVLPFPDDPPRAHEEMQLLVIGFATGLTIGGVFLIYIILSAAHLLT